MLIYNYDGQTGVFSGSTVAEPDPMELQLARDAVFGPLIAAAQVAQQSAQAVAQAALQNATAEPGLSADEWEEARAAYEFALSAAQQTYEAAIAVARLKAGKVKPALFLIPANATVTPPPQFDFDQVAVWENGAWHVRDDEEGDGTPDEAELEQDLAAEVRQERNRRIAVVRWIIDRHRDELALGRTTTLTPEDYRVVLQYVQNLRDVPEQEAFPETLAWPALHPALLASGV
jgi:hypothetical protein